MRSVLLVLALALAAFAEEQSKEASWGATPEKLERARQALAKKWLVGFEKDFAKEVRKLVNELGGKVNRQFKITEAMSIDLPTTADDDERHPLIRRLLQHRGVEYVEKDLPRFPSAETVPYGVTRVQSQQVWNSSDVPTKGAGSIVCVIDGGLDNTHEDFVDASIVNENPVSEWNYNGCNHGNHVSGTIGAVSFNDVGVASVAPEVSQYIIRVFNGDDCGFSYAGGLIGAVEDCIADGNSDIISMSLSGGGYVESSARAYSNAYRLYDVLSVAAAGNSGNSNYAYPASYEAVMSVAATNSNNQRASFSQFNDAVDIAAPGVGVLSTITAGDGSSSYASYQGTSMATPHVSAVAALTLATRPDIPMSKVRYCLEHTAADLGSEGWDEQYGWGLVQAYAAHQCALKVFRSTQDCNYVTTGERVYGFNTCQKFTNEESTRRFYKMIVPESENCPALDSELVYITYTSMEDCEANTNGQTFDLGFSDMICNGYKEDSCQVTVTGWTVPEGVDCENDISDASYFNGTDSRFQRSIVIDACVNVDSDNLRESYKWSTDATSGSFSYLYYNELDCNPDFLVTHWSPPSNCQTMKESTTAADRVSNIVDHLDFGIDIGTEVYLSWDVSGVTEITTPSPVTEDERAETTTAAPRRVVEEYCSSAKETTIDQETRDKVTDVVIKVPDTLNLDANEHNLFVSVVFNHTMIDLLSVYLYHQNSSALLMESLCENKKVKLDVRLSDLGVNDIAAYCDFFSGTDTWVEVKTEDTIDEVFFGQLGGSWTVQFRDANHEVNEEDNEEGIGRVCVGWQQLSQDGSAHGSHLSFVLFLLVSMVVLFVSS